MNKKLIKIMSLLVVFSSLLTGCSQGNTTSSSNTNQTQPSNSDYLNEVPDVLLTVNNHDFTVVLEDNDTARDLVSEITTSPMLLPPVSDVDNTLKSYDLPRDFTSNPEDMDSASVGDVFLDGSDNLILFYKDANISGSYTKVGHVEDHTGMEEAIRDGDSSFYVSIK